MSNIHNAAERGDLEAVKMLLKKDPNLVFSRDDSGETPLHGAAYEGRREVAEALLANKADVNARNYEGETPLHWAAIAGHLDVAKVLLAAKADANVEAPNGYTPLRLAEIEGYHDVVEVLLQNCGRK